MKYAVAHMDFYNNDLKIVIIKRNDPITALVEGVRKIRKVKEGDIDTQKWLDSFLENISSVGPWNDRLEDIKQEFFNSDQLVAVEEIR